MACENVARLMKIKMKQKIWMEYFVWNFWKFSIFCGEKELFPLPPKISIYPPKIPKSLNKNLNLPIQFQSIQLLSFHYNPIQLHCSPQPHCLYLKKSPSPKSKNYRKTLINYRIPITKMLQFCPSFGASLPSSTPRQPFLATFLGFWRTLSLLVYSHSALRLKRLLRG